MFVLEYGDGFDDDEDDEEAEDDGEIFEDISDWTKISFQDQIKYSLLRTRYSAYSFIGIIWWR